MISLMDMELVNKTERARNRIYIMIPLLPLVKGEEALTKILILDLDSLTPTSGDSGPDLTRDSETLATSATCRAWAGLEVSKAVASHLCSQVRSQEGQVLNQ